MSVIIDSMSRKIFLDICSAIEGLCAELYHHYRNIYEDIPEASHLWMKTALEEEHHQKQFKLAILLWEETEFEVLHDSMRMAYLIQFKLLELMRNIRSTKPDLKTAISTAVEMEEKLADLHAHTSLQFKEASIQQLFAALSEADHNHAAKLRRYRSVLYLPVTGTDE